MTAARFRLALERTGAAQWKQFEDLALAFLASQYPNVRPMATSSGDGGRDAELFSSDGHTHLKFQISVTKEWKSKILDTIKRIQEIDKDTKVLIYVSCQQIGAEADQLKKQAIEKFSIVLDTLDIEWFVTRYAGHAGSSLERTADEYSRQLVDPLLEERGLISRSVVGLSDSEARAALIYLELQWENDGNYGDEIPSPAAMQPAQGGVIEITPAMVERGVSFLRESLGDRYPYDHLSDDRQAAGETVLGVIRAALGQTAASRKTRTGRRTKPESSALATEAL